MTGRRIQTVVRALAAGAIAVSVLLSGAAARVPTPSVSVLPGSLAPPSLWSTNAAPWTPMFSVAALVNEDGSLRVTERIVEDMGDTPRHGIERIIPQYEDTAAGSRRQFEITDLSVATSRGTPGDTALQAGSDSLTVRIGDPDRTITGVHAYQISYTIEALVTARPERLELLWDPISSWSEPIGDFDARLTSPASLLEASCVTGPPGATDPCVSVRTSGTTFSLALSPMASGQAITVAASWAPDAFGPVAAPVPVPGWLERVGGLPTLVVCAIALGLLLVAELLLGRQARRLLAVTPASLSATFDLDAADQTTPATLADNGLPTLAPPDLAAVGDEPVIEFVPPQHLPPAVLAELLGTSAATERLTATAIDLAARGYFDITETSTPSLLGSTRDWTLTWRGASDPRPLHPHEQDVLETLFAAQPTVALSARRAVMPALASRHDRAVRDLLRHRGLLNRRAAGPSIAHWLAGALTAAALILTTGALALGADSPGTALVLIPAAVLCALATVLIPLTSLTPLGAAMAWRARGFEKLFTHSESYHAELAANAGVLRQYMGYAVCLGGIDRWTSAFPAQVVDQSAPTFHPMSVAAFGSSFASAATVSHSSTRGGSFGHSSGAGGGGGGGGGGSW